MAAHNEGAGLIANDQDQIKYSEFVRFIQNDTDAQLQENPPAGIWANEFSSIDNNLTTDSSSDWVKDFAESKQSGGKITECLYNAYHKNPSSIISLQMLKVKITITNSGTIYKMYGVDYRRKVKINHHGYRNLAIIMIRIR